MRSDMKTYRKPPPPPELGDPAAERPKGKRPWNKPQIKVIRVNFTASGFNANPEIDEVNDGDGHGVAGGPQATYRTS